MFKAWSGYYQSALMTHDTCTTILNPERLRQTNHSLVSQITTKIQLRDKILKAAAVAMNVRCDCVGKENVQPCALLVRTVGPCAQGRVMLTRAEQACASSMISTNHDMT